MLMSMKDRACARQFAKRAGLGKLGSDSGFALFVEILAREAVRSLIASEDEQPRTRAARDAPATSKKPLSRIADIVAFCRDPFSPTRWRGPRAKHLVGCVIEGGAAEKDRPARNKDRAERIGSCLAGVFSETP
jgi:hypothetical protein